MDTGVGAMLYLAIASWLLGQVEGATSLVKRARQRAATVTHVGTLALEKLLTSMFELMRGDVEKVTANTTELVRLADAHDLSLWRAYGVYLKRWVASHSGDVALGLEEMRRGGELLRDQKVTLFDGLVDLNYRALNPPLLAQRMRF
jgi:hypothetical protein